MPHSLPPTTTVDLALKMGGNLSSAGAAPTTGSDKDVGELVGGVRDRRFAVGIDEKASLKEPLAA